MFSIITERLIMILQKIDGTKCIGNWHCAISAKKILFAAILMFYAGGMLLFAKGSVNGLLLHYKFDEGKEYVVRDSSGNNNDGKLVSRQKNSPSSPQWVTMADAFNKQNFGYAIAMSYAVNCGKSPQLDLSGTEMTLEIWFKTGKNIRKLIPLIGKSRTKGKTFFRGYNLSINKNLRLWLNFGDTHKAFVDNKTEIEPNTFYHVIATYNGKFVKIYVNGRLDVSKGESRAVVGASKKSLWIGSPWGEAGDTLIDEVKIYNRALSVREINASYNDDKPRGQYKPLSDKPISSNTSSNLLFNTTFKQCANPGIPDWWGTYSGAMMRDWEGVYGIDNSMTPPVPGVKCLRIKNPWDAGTGRKFDITSTRTRQPGGKEYTFSVYLKADNPGIIATISGVISSKEKRKIAKTVHLTTEWKRYVMNGYREGSSVMKGIHVDIGGKGIVWMAAPQLEYGMKATPYRPNDMEINTGKNKVNVNLPKAECAVVNTSPVIDGKLDDTCWQKVHKLGNFKLLGSNTPTAVGTDAWICHDAKNLYIAFKCHEPEINNLKAKVKRQNGPVYNDDDIEIFLSTDPNADNYYHMAVNPMAVRYSTFKGLNTDWKCATTKGKDFWSVECAVPIRLLNRFPVKLPWRINLCRTRRAGKKVEYSSWAPIEARGFHTPDCFGWLTGIAAISRNVASPKADIPTRPKLRAMTEYNYYTNDEFANLFIDWSLSIPAEIKLKLNDVSTGKVLHPLNKTIKISKASRSWIKFPLEKLADGQYQITFKAIVNGRIAATVKDCFYKLPENPVKVRINKPKRCLSVNNKPFFVFGSCISVNMCLRYGIKENNWQLDDIKSHGFNAMWTDGLLSAKPNEYKMFLDECQRKDLKVLLALNQGSHKFNYTKIKKRTLEVVRQLKNHPAILAWGFVDEPDLWWESKERKEADLLDLYNAIKAEDPYRPAVINWCFFNNPPYGSLKATDIASVDRYPLHYDNFDFKPAIVLDESREINRCAAPGNKPTNFYLQMQGLWDMSREPTPTEVRWMSYVNFICGTRSLMYWIYKPMSPRLWESMRLLSKELREFFNLTISLNAYEVMNGKQGQLIYSLWKNGDNYYLFYANTTMKAIVANLDLSRCIPKGITKITPISGTADVKISHIKTTTGLTFSLKPIQSGACCLK